MPDKIKFFTVDFRDNFAYISDKKFPIGSFVINFLNQYYEDDTALRISCMSIDNLVLSNTIERGYVNEKEFIGVGKEILNILTALPRLLPFNLLDIESEIELIKETFTKENAAYLMEYYMQRANISLQDEGAHLMHIVPDGYNEFCMEATKLVTRVTNLLRFYGSFGSDFTKAHDKLMKFIRGLNDIEHYNESGLLEYAQEIFGIDRVTLSSEYVAIPKNSKSQEMVLAKRTHFGSYYSFIITDFFEGLHYGHYPRRCEVCKKYFLMESARKQKYCTGFAPLELTGGEKTTCRKFAAKNKQKELAANDPIVNIYTRRCNCIRAEKSKGVISEEFAEAAKETAKDLMYKFRREDDYTLDDFERDMQKKNLYKLTEENSLFKNG